MRYVFLACALFWLSVGVALADDPTKVLVADWNAMDYAAGHVRDSINTLVQQNTVLQSRIAELEKKCGDACKAPQAQVEPTK